MRTLSPSVTVTEIDKSIFVQSAATQPTALLANFKWGPVGDPTIISNELQLVQYYGKPTKSNATTWHTGSDFLQYANSLYASRVVDSATARNAVDNSQSLISLVLTNVAGDFDNVTTVNVGSVPALQGVDITSWDADNSVLTLDVDSLSVADLTTLNNLVVVDAVGPTVAASGKVFVAVGNHIYLPNDAKAEALINAGATLKGNTANINPIFVARYPGKYGNNVAVAIVDHFASNVTLTGVGFKLSNIETLVQPLDAYTGTSSYAINRGFAGIRDLFHIVVVDTTGEISGATGTILERFEFVSKLANSTNDGNEKIYWKDVINSRSEYVWAFNDPVAYGTPSPTQPTAKYVGVASETLLVTSVNDYAGPFVAPITVAGNTVANGDYFLLTAQNPLDPTIAANGLYQWTQVLTTGEGYAQVIATGINDVCYVSSTNQYFRLTTAATSTDLFASAAQALFTVLIPQVVQSGTLLDSNGEKFGGWGIDLLVDIPTVADLTHMSTVASNNVAGGMTNGFTAPLTNGYDGSTPSVGDYEDVLDANFQREQLTIRQIIGGAADVILAKFLISFCEKRQDCIVFLTPEASTQVGLTDQNKIVKNVVNWTKNTLNTPSSYGFLDGGWYLKYDRYTDRNIWVPLCGQTAGLSAQVDSNLQPWFAFSGYIRGIYKNVLRLAYNPNISQRDLLFPAGVNPVISEPSNGVILLGDTTLLTAASAFNQVSIRKLFIVVEEQIRQYAKFKMFDFNDAISRQEFLNAIIPFLNDIKSKRGLEDYQIVCDESNNTPQVIQNHEFAANIKIKPLYTIRWVQLTFTAVGPTVNFDQA